MKTPTMTPTNSNPSSPIATARQSIVSFRQSIQETIPEEESSEAEVKILQPEIPEFLYQSLRVDESEIVSEKPVATARSSTKTIEKISVKESTTIEDLPKDDPKSATREFSKISIHETEKTITPRPDLKKIDPK